MLDLLALAVLMLAVALCGAFAVLGLSSATEQGRPYLVGEI
jgi:hypothetical protein